MKSRENQEFIDFWEKNRARRATFSYQFWFGLPIGMLFSLPILVNFILGQFWYKRADAVGSSQFNPLVLVIGVIFIATFAAILYKKFQWERNEDRYKELTRKKG